MMYRPREGRKKEKGHMTYSAAIGFLVSKGIGPVSLSPRSQIQWRPFSLKKGLYKNGVSV